MLARYSREPMRAVWREERRLKLWLEIELLAVEAMARLGRVPPEEAVLIRERVGFSAAEIHKREERTQHEILAFLEEIASHAGEAGRWLHHGLTSSDVLDTALALQLREACDLLHQDLLSLRITIGEQARRHAFVPMIGRTHGVHAEPITYGLKLALMYDEFGRAIDRLLAAREQISVGKLSGAVGTYAHLDPVVEEEVCQKLGLTPAPASNQIIQRDRHAHLTTTLALIGCSIERWAVEFRHLQRTEVLEVEEPFAPGQKGSSAMPHKRNPILSERLCGLARLLRGYSLAAMENVPLWHERDISHSSAERMIFPDATTLLDYMLVLLDRLVADQSVYPDRMAANLARSKGLYASEGILLALVRKGLARKEAYELVQEAAMKCWRGTEPFPTYLRQTPQIARLLSPEEVERVCSLESYCRHIGDTFKRVGLQPPEP
ncbi:adenylosuccinate lyase [Methylacidimicrobium cyclopophantes]|uniref:Adenylosuccinate lyase n=1 Tax=Methylacidimicrobium cyclopophantes TaxID=1041766 RepID=A0A5E6MBL1_9BACT|nr:adenylosuccinate lyase [Methylacidimicrobium cyclopophantes]VVM06360.1 adenylosuccinate lyase [Methylacidimicrobium cyclopophantes]